MEARVRRHHRFRADCDILDRKPSSRRRSPGTGTRIALLAALVGLALSFATSATAGPVRLGFWLSLSEITSRPMSGTPWTRLKAAADGSLGTPNLADNNTDHDARTLAAALVYARTGTASYRTKAANGIMSAIGTENNYGASWLSVGMNLNSYVIAADIVNLAEYNPSSDAQFRSWLSSLRNKVLGDRTLNSTNNDRPNNWGTYAGATRVSVDLYLNDVADIANAVKTFRGMLGDRSIYAGFKYGSDLSWQANPSAPVGINPPGATIQGRNVDGVIPDDQRRAGSFRWPAPCENHVRMGMNGLVVEAQLLARAGYPAWTWSSSAIKRATTWLTTVTGCGFPGDDVWMPYLLNKAYGLNLSLDPTSDYGKNISWVSWTHGAGSSSSPPPPNNGGGTPPPPGGTGLTKYVSDMTWTSSTNGWGPAERNRSNGDRGATDGRTITLQGVAYAKGIGAHAASDIRVSATGCSRFQSAIGIDDEVGSSGNAIFEVWKNGIKAYSSGAMTGSTATKTVDIALSSVNELRLVVLTNGVLNSDHADWADARLTC
jgi:hypothetical protein